MEGVKLQKKTEEVSERTEEAQVLNMEGDYNLGRMKPSEPVFFHIRERRF